jgi:integrase
MSQVVVRSPLKELELADEDGLQPYALGHLRLREPLAPSSTPRLWKIGERALVDLKPSELLEQLRTRDGRDANALHIRKSKNEGSKRILPLNEAALAAVKMMIERADELGHKDPGHYLWCANQHHTFDPTKPGRKWDTAWRALRDAAGLRGLRFHDLRHTVVTRLLEAGEPDHVVESITGHLSRRMLEHYSHIRLSAKKAALDRLGKREQRAKK